MAEGRTRRRFTAEFKAEAVQRLLEGGRGLSEVATELGPSPGQLSQWRNERLAAGSAEAVAQRKAEQAETQRLRREGKPAEAGAGHRPAEPGAHREAGGGVRGGVGAAQGGTGRDAAAAA